MQYTKVGNLKIPKLSLGTMMWGEQVDLQQAFKQMDFCLEHGINFFDTAEMYTIPAKASTQGFTESIIGKYFQSKPQVREKVILASKFSPKGCRTMTYLRNGNHYADKSNIHQALNESLQRLNTDYLDLYQVHWPDRSANIFGNRYFKYNKDEDGISIPETLEVLSELIKSQKIRHIGISNESPWGMMQWLQAAKELNLEKIITIQNPYSLLNRHFEIASAEVSHYENIKLLAYSTLAMGSLSGKYLNDALPKNSRRELYPVYSSRYQSENANNAIKLYTEIANRINITPSQLAISFALSQDFLASVILGATSIDQLQENIAAIDIELDSETLQQINHVNSLYPDPCP